MSPVLAGGLTFVAVVMLLFAIPPAWANKLGALLSPSGGRSADGAGPSAARAGRPGPTPYDRLADPNEWPGWARLELIDITQLPETREAER